MRAELSVAHYLPIDGNVRHWALYLKTPSEDLIYQVTGAATAFEYGDREGIVPQDSARFVELVLVSEIDSKAVEAVKEILATHPIDNGVATWSCQDWVLEAIEALHEEDLLEESVYEDVRDQLMEAYN